MGPTTAATMPVYQPPPVKSRPVIRSPTRTTLACQGRWWIAGPVIRTRSVIGSVAVATFGVGHQQEPFRGLGCGSRQVDSVAAAPPASGTSFTGFRSTG